MLFCCRDDLPKIVVQLVHVDHHFLVQRLGSDIAYLFADQAKTLLVEFQDQLVTVSDSSPGDRSHSRNVVLTYIFGDLQLQFSRQRE